MADQDELSRGWVRALWPGEEERLVAHLMRLSPDDRYGRFLGTADEETVRRHVERARGAGRWQVIGWFEGGVLRAAVEVVTVGGEAEAALTTEPGYRRRGVAGRLLARATRRAALAGAERLVLYTSSSNAAVVRLARNAGMHCRADGCEIKAEVALTRPDPVAVSRDAIEERQGQLASASAQLFPLATQVWWAALSPAAPPAGGAEAP
ncbi:MAG TPA: GNAT family N-acetyltransferase [Thermohalobaculum sp.]|nr:GNAT family N-acetyltransferase [Thermohalobaculum sp.]